MVGQSDCTGLVAEDRVEGGIGGHFDGRAGSVGHGGAFRRRSPAEEDLVRGFVVLDDCVGVLGVAVAVNDKRLVVVDAVDQRVAGLAADLGVQVIIAADLGIEVERGAVRKRPAVELVIGSNVDTAFRRLIFRDLRAVRDARDLVQFGCILPESHGMDRSDPPGVEGNVLRRHGLAGEDIHVACALLVVVPADKDVAFLAFGRGGGCVGFLGDIRSELDGLSLYHLAAADEYEVIAVAFIIELCAVISIAVFRTQTCIACKAGDRIAVFL